MRIFEFTTIRITFKKWIIFSAYLLIFSFMLRGFLPRPSEGLNKLHAMLSNHHLPVQLVNFEAPEDEENSGKPFSHRPRSEGSADGSQTMTLFGLLEVVPYPNPSQKRLFFYTSSLSLQTLSLGPSERPPKI